MSVPDGFWTGEAKLAWLMDDVQQISAVFPTIYLSFAMYNNPSHAFSLAVTPQVSHSYHSAGGVLGDGCQPQAPMHARHTTSSLLFRSTSVRSQGRQMSRRPPTAFLSVTSSPLASRRGREVGTCGKWEGQVGGVGSCFLSTSNILRSGGLVLWFAWLVLDGCGHVILYCPCSCPCSLLDWFPQLHDYRVVLRGGLVQPGTSSLTGTVIGGNVMLGFTTVFDRERKRVGFASTTCKRE